MWLSGLVGEAFMEDAAREICLIFYTQPAPSQGLVEHLRKVGMEDSTA